jgi:putative peptide zinc metalloprotease protein
MDNSPPAAGEVERRKHVKLRLRRDLIIEAQRYEGKTFYVVKDPISLRYYRLKDNEHFLLQYLDGRRTLEDAQKAYEKYFRPDRLKLEDLEAFAQQLIKAGLAQNDSPKAGQQLYKNRNKRLRQEWFQYLTNILYIKIPLFDPDRLLTRMLPWMGWIISFTFGVVSVGVMLAALLLITTHFETFRSKLPDYHAFFNFRTVAYLWVALGCVKVIHEFGHGLSCKAFGGEVHEMGFLFLCLSPALYCNVSDAWTLPNKWHRIIISAAGIWVELVIAAIATFVWWNTPQHPFTNNMALSLMVVCSVSTVVFNANPLMRYDGYYVLADWLEIPNLRERSNRFLKNTVLEHCLGVEVQPEPYMALWRKCLFISYAIVSYVYRWVVTFSILYFLYSFLRPYKLEVISSLLAVAAFASLTGWPIGRLIRNIYRRGRLPDMKRWRVMVTCTVVVGFVLFLFLVPVPLGRVRGVGLVQAQADYSSKLYVKQPGTLEKLFVRPGDKVKAGDVVAIFRNLEMEAEEQAALLDVTTYGHQCKLLEDQLRETKDPKERSRLIAEQSETQSKKAMAETKAAVLRKLRTEEMVLKAPRDGIVGKAPPVDEVGKGFDKDPIRSFCTIHEPRKLRIAVPLVTADFNRLKQNLEQLTPAAQATQRLLHEPRKVVLVCDKMPLSEVLSRLEKQAPGLHLWLDPQAHVSAEQIIENYRTEGRRPLSTVLDELFGTIGLGYVILSEEGDHDGWVRVAPGPERGTPLGGRPLADLEVMVRVHGRDSHTWKGRITSLPESEAKTIPEELSSKAGGPVATKAQGLTPQQAAKAGIRSDPLVPQTQHFIVYVEMIDPDDAIVPGTRAQVKVRCQPQTCVHWLWHKVNDTFDLGLW